MGPIVLRRARGNAQHCRRFFDGHADKVTQLDHSRCHWILSGQEVESFMNSQHFLCRSAEFDSGLVEFFQWTTALAFQAGLVASLVD